MTRLFFALCLVAFSVIAPVNGYAEIEKPRTAIEFTNAVIEERCKETGGEWVMFADGCADTCYRVERENVSCPRVFRRSCECGPEKCWETGTVACVTNESVKKEIKKQ